MWSGGTYYSKIKSTLDDLANSKYQSEYTDKINNTTNAIENYGDYTSKYQPDIDNLTGQINNYGDYTSKYQSNIDDLTNKLTNWNYDPESDTSYQAYKNQYTNLGNTAMKNTLGQVSARTGGLASSYAGSAAQQSYNDYMQQLADIIPTLENQAYNRASNNLSLYQNLDNTDYTRWQDALNNLYNRSSYLQGLDSTDYTRWQDALSNLYNQNSMYQNLDSNAYSQWQGNNDYLYDLMSAWEDWDDAEYEEYLNNLAAAAAASSGSSGGSGGSYSSGSSGNSNYTEEDLAANSLGLLASGASIKDVASSIKSAAEANGLTGSQAVRVTNDVIASAPLSNYSKLSSGLANTTLSAIKNRLS